MISPAPSRFWATGQHAVAPGDAVFGVVMKPYLGGGSFASYVAVSEQFGIEHLPAEVDPASGGALGLAGSAALAAMDAAALHDGETVSLWERRAESLPRGPVRQARRGKSDCYGTPGGGSGNSSVVLEQVMLWTTPGTWRVRFGDIAPEGVAAVIHLAGDPTGPAELLAPGGRIVSTLGYGPEQNAAAVAVRANPDSTTLTRLADDASAGRLLVPIGCTYDFEAIPSAFEDFASGTLGKLALIIA